MNNFEEIIVTCRQGVSDADLLEVLRSLPQWGGKELIAQWSHIAAFHVRLEINRTMAEFVHKGSGTPTWSKIEDVSRAEPLEFAISNSASVIVGPNLRLDAWWHQRLDVSRAHRRGIFGRGVRIAIIDSGVAFHPELFSLDAGAVLASCYDESPVFHHRQFAADVFPHWISDNPDILKKTRLDYVSTLPVWAPYSNTALIDRLNKFVNNPTHRNLHFTHVELTAMSPRVLSALSLGDLSIDDLANFGGAIQLQHQCRAFVSEVLSGLFALDWPIVRTRYVRLFRANKELLYALLSKTWGDGDIPRLIHPESSGLHGSPDFVDVHGHGTYLAGILFSSVTGICPQAECVAIKCRGDNDATNVGGLIEALRLAVISKAQIAVIGLFLSPKDHVTPALERAFEHAFQNGVLVFVPASKGNRLTAMAFNNTIAVGSIADNGWPIGLAATSPAVSLVDIWSFGGGTHPATLTGIPRNEFTDFTDRTRIACLRIGGGSILREGLRLRLRRPLASRH